MPRESFADRSGFTAEVSWSDNHLQLATLSNDQDSFVAWCREIVESHDKARAALKSTPPHPLTGGDVQHISDPNRLISVGSMGMFWTPERHNVQDLIKALRRARDRVWGADE